MTRAEAQALQEQLQVGFQRKGWAVEVRVVIDPQEEHGFRIDWSADPEEVRRIGRLSKLS